jgi:hypothetical protein
LKQFRSKKAVKIGTFNPLPRPSKRALIIEQEQAFALWLSEQLTIVGLAPDFSLVLLKD